MDSSNLSQHTEPRVALSTDEELMLFPVLMCTSERPQAAKPAVEPKTNLSFGPNNQPSPGLANTNSSTGVAL
jgi:hypothetical protein